MTTPDERLGIPEWADNWTLGPGLRFELMEIATRRVFLYQPPVTAAELAEFDVPEGFTHVLAGAAQADMAFFSRSPGADGDGPVEIVELGGRRFAHIAQPMGIDTAASGAVEMTIDKHHALLHRAGRVLDVLDFGDGTVATPAWGAPDPAVGLTDRMLEDEWTLRRLRLTTDLLVTIPNPARVIVLDESFGFHGPIDGALIEDLSEDAFTP